VNIYSLLYFKEGTQAPVNLGKKSDIHDTYLANAFLLQQSLKNSKYTHKIITNSKSRIQNFINRTGQIIDFIEVDFKWQIPINIKFHEAHYKLELYEMFSSGSFGDQIMLVDTDLIFSDNSEKLLNIISKNEENIFVFDVKGIELNKDDQKEHEKAINYLLSYKIKSFNWYGGEFIVATPSAFKEITKGIKKYLPFYLDSLNLLPHQGDEMLLNTVLNSEIKFEVIDINNFIKGNAIMRYWSAGTHLPQRRFAEIQDSHILHFPADKPFLAKESFTKYNYKKFIKNYKKYLFFKAIFRSIFYFFRNSFKKKRYAPKS
tara:strand:- start:11009 stop:11959 length:951 start_codon:yes stop_codon:yes gene_type:complete